MEGRAARRERYSGGGRGGDQSILSMTARMIARSLRRLRSVAFEARIKREELIECDALFRPADDICSITSSRASATRRCRVRRGAKSIRAGASATNPPLKTVASYKVMLATATALVKSLAWTVLVSLPAVMELDGFTFNVLISNVNYLTGIGVRMEVTFVDVPAWCGRVPNEAMCERAERHKEKRNRS
jgi:hypothetical protein